MTDPMDHQTIQVIEKDPGTGEIFNGIPDWVYEGRHLLPNVDFFFFVLFFTGEGVCKILRCIIAWSLISLDFSLDIWTLYIERSFWTAGILFIFYN